MDVGAPGWSGQIPDRCGDCMARIHRLQSMQDSHDLRIRGYNALSETMDSKLRQTSRTIRIAKWQESGRTKMPRKKQ